MVVVVGDDDLGPVGRDPSRIGELAGFGPLRAPCQRFAAFEVEPLDAVVGAVGDEHVGGGHGDPAAGRLRGVLRGAEVELSDFAAALAPGADEAAGRGELLDPVVGGVDDVDVAGRVGGDAADRTELAVTASVGAPFGDQRAGGRELLHGVAELVGDVDVPRGRDRDGLGETEHPFGAVADRADGGVGTRRAAAARAAFGVGEGGDQPARDLHADEGEEDQAQPEHRTMTTRGRRRGRGRGFDRARRSRGRAGRHPKTGQRPPGVQRRPGLALSGLRTGSCPRPPACGRGARRGWRERSPRGPRPRDGSALRRRCRAAGA